MPFPFFNNKKFTPASGVNAVSDTKAGGVDGLLATIVGGASFKVFRGQVAGFFQKFWVQVNKNLLDGIGSAALLLVAMKYLGVLDWLGSVIKKSPFFHSAKEAVTEDLEKTDNAIRAQMKEYQKDDPRVIVQKIKIHICIEDLDNIGSNYHQWSKKDKEWDDQWSKKAKECYDLKDALEKIQDTIQEEHKKEHATTLVNVLFKAATGDPAAIVGVGSAVCVAARILIYDLPSWFQKKSADNLSDSVLTSAVLVYLDPTDSSLPEAEMVGEVS